jgi:hypothetical protein
MFQKPGPRRYEDDITTVCLNSLVALLSANSILSSIPNHTHTHEPHNAILNRSASLRKGCGFQGTKRPHTSMCNVHAQRGQSRSIPLLIAVERSPRRTHISLHMSRDVAAVHEAVGAPFRSMYRIRYSYPSTA